MSCYSSNNGTPTHEPGDHPGDTLSTGGSTELINRIRALAAEKIRLQALVCELLCENAQLRMPEPNLITEQHSRRSRP